ncbi:PREDICTED: uncharacterized protein LOC108757175 [Trachymyrmex septentrionalis]|uniref:uncharacterized protein LOC108757175 n=1 Tax=Trachymyrmex septentrionalis TaxID=34720 RepID=UPI00084F1360|nr:PREDICTED: uncharacterized protein LOC108757175 [Trachymyrmex septentrionalis]
MFKRNVCRNVIFVNVGIQKMCQGNSRKQDKRREITHQQNKKTLTSSRRIDLLYVAKAISEDDLWWNSESAKITDHPCKRNRTSFPRVDFGHNISYQRYYFAREYGKLQDAPGSLTNRGFSKYFMRNNIEKNLIELLLSSMITDIAIIATNENSKNNLEQLHSHNDKNNGAPHLIYR